MTYDKASYDNTSKDETLWSLKGGLGKAKILKEKANFNTLFSFMLLDTNVKYTL